MAYEGGDFSRMEELPYKIMPGEIGNYYDNIFLERAIIGERLRATIGLPIRKVSEHAQFFRKVLIKVLLMKNTMIHHLLI